MEGGGVFEAREGVPESQPVKVSILPGPRLPQSR